MSAASCSTCPSTRSEAADSTPSAYAARASSLRPIPSFIALPGAAVAARERPLEKVGVVLEQCPCHVAVRVRCQGDLRMAELLHDAPHIGALREQKRSG